MTDLLTKLLDHHSQVPSHLSTGGLRSPSQAYDTEVPPTPEQNRIQSQLEAVADLLDTPAPPSLAELVATTTTPAKLRAAVHDAAAAQTQRAWVGKAGADLRRRLMHERVAASSHPDVYDATVAHLGAEIEDSVSGLLIAAKEFGSKLLGDTADLLSQDATLVQRVKTSVAQLSSIARMRVDGAVRGDHLRVVATFAALDADEADEETLALAGSAAKKSVGVLLGALALGLIPGLRLDVASDWATVQQRRQELDELRAALAESEPTVSMAENLLSLEAEGFEG